MVNYKTFLATVAAFTMMASTSHAEFAPTTVGGGGGLVGGGQIGVLLSNGAYLHTIIQPLPPGIDPYSDEFQKQLPRLAALFALKHGYKECDTPLVWPSSFFQGFGIEEGSYVIELKCYK